MNSWMVRLGSEGGWEQSAFEHDVVMIGWSGVGALNRFADVDRLRTELRRRYPRSGKPRIWSWAGQLWNFYREIQEGDYLAMPLEDGGTVAVGQVKGPYRYDPNLSKEAPHVRSVKWRESGVHWDDIGPDLRVGMWSSLTVSRLAMPEADRRFAWIFAEGKDSDAAAGEMPLDDRWVLMADAAERPPAEPMKLTVRELMKAWGSTRRTAETLAKIEADLLAHGLVAVPPISEVWVENEIDLIVVGRAPAPDEVGNAGQEAEPEERDEGPAVAQQIGALRTANMEVASVRPTDDLSVAASSMMLNGYSQLAVIDDDGTFLGSVTWESVAQAQQHRQRPKVSHARVEVGAVHRAKELLPAIEEISKNGYVFVQDGKGKITGIVTTSDLTYLLGAQIQPFLVLEEIENRLRRAAARCFTVDEMRAVVKKFLRKRFKSAEDLTFGDYKYLFAKQEHFDRLGWSLLNRRYFIEQHELARRARNDLMHFTPDELGAERLQQLEGFRDMIRGADSKR